MAKKKKAREGFYSEWCGGVVMWYWPEDEMLLYVFKRGGSGPISLQRFPPEAYNDLKRQHKINNRGYAFKRVQIGINLVDRWLDPDWKEDEDEDPK